MYKTTESWNERYARVIARAWTDESFKKKLLAEPAAALAEFDIRIPESVSVVVVENTASTVNLVLPKVPFEGDLSDSDLQNLAAADTPTGFCCTHDCLIGPGGGVLSQ
ncbi:NHLP leader peptide family RiPP precursor [Roseovarius aestuarii]|uniref:Nitrile hydratase, alpha chain n=1 Tax=Roseovarius aestuarii TaxID=475083 RepID=A0A1X7BTD5_9RHOB|nr:NHLP leader peptide family RiPP precursor [Roseovarius aestuarii]SMC12868.1 Nitrile hydratase, alpha chain [Roseovarius aestuarii]